MMHWSAKYVGMPFKERGRTAAGVDYWGLVRLVYAGELGIDLPSYAEDYASVIELAELDRLLRGAIDAGDWLSTPEPRQFDVLLFRRGRFESHVGIYVAPKMMLHVAAGDSAKIESHFGPVWRLRYMGYYRRIGT